LKEQVRAVLPTFQSILGDIRARDIITLNDQDYQMALKTRNELILIFSNAERLGLEFKREANKTSCSGRLNLNIWHAIRQFIVNHSFTLQLLPSISTKEAREKNYKAAIQEQISQLKSQQDEARSSNRYDDAETLGLALQQLYDELKSMHFSQ
jgi:hypothetical protein